MPHLTFVSPVGNLTLFEDGNALIALEWGKTPGSQTTPLLRRAKSQIDDYFVGALSAFDLPLEPAGTDFQKAVWRQMQLIPLGETKSYGDIAKALGSAARAVGGACGKNPLPIIIPCHRIVGAGGRLGGFSGGEGIPTKQALLRLESVLKQKQ